MSMIQDAYNSYLKLWNLEEELKTLSPTHQIAFAAACCERLLPNYQIFVRKEGFDTHLSMLPRLALNEVWGFLGGKPLDVPKLHQFIDDMRTIHTEDATTEHGPEAERALLAIFYILELCIEPKFEYLQIVVKQSRETIYEFLDCKFDNSDDNWDKKSLAEQLKIINNHPFSLREIAKQKEDLKLLKETPILNNEILKWLRTSFDNNSRSIIDLA